MFFYFTIAIILLISIVTMLSIYIYAINNQINKKVILKYLFLSTLFAIILGSVISPLQVSKDTIVLTAMGTGQKGEVGVDEIFFSKYVVDGKEYLPLESLDIEKGKWFWANTAYAWRLETDKRQPDGVTREVQLKIPVGEEREIKFLSGPYCGKVQVSTDTDTELINTYSEIDGELSFNIGSSSPIMLIINALIKIVIFAIIYILLVYFSLRLVLFWYKHPKKMEQWITVHDIHCICAIISLVALFIMIKNVTNDNLWGDELLQIDWISNGMKHAIDANLFLVDATPPLYNIVCTLLYDFIPYGQTWILLISIIPTVISIYLIGYVANEIAGKYAGILASIFMATSSTVYVQIAWELRAYSFAMFFATLSIYAFHNKLIKDKFSSKLLFSIAMVGLSMSHYFGMLVCGFYFIGDLYLLIKKRIKLSDFFVYIAPGIIDLLWIIAVYRSVLQTVSPAQIVAPKIVPGIGALQTQISYLVGKNEIAYYILLIGLAFALVRIISKKIEDEEFVYLHCSFTVIGVLVGLVIFGRYISPDFTLWEPRYFTVLIPAICIVCAFITNKIVRRFGNKNCICTIILTLSIVLGFYGIPLASETKLAPRIESAANQIYSDVNNVYNDTSLVVQAWWGRGDGFNEYYLSQQGRREYLNCIHYTQLDSYLQNDQEYNRIYVVELVTGYAGQVTDVLLKNGFKLSEERSDIGLYIYDKIL